MTQEKWTKFWNAVAAIALAVSVLATTLAGIAIWSTPVEELVARSYQTKCYRTDGGDKWVCASGGEMELQSGATLDVQSGATSGFGGDVTIDGTLDVDGNISSGTGAITVTDDMQVTGPLTVTGAFNPVGNISSAAGAVTVTDNVMIDGAAGAVQLTVQGAPDQEGVILVVEDSAGSDKIQIDASGNVTDTGSILIDGAADAHQFTVQGHSTQNNNLVLLEQSGGTDVVTINNDGDIDAEGTLNIAGDATFQADLYVEGQATWTSAGMVVIEDSIISGTLTVDTVVVTDTLDVDGDIDLDGDGFDVDITAGGAIATDSTLALSASADDITLDAEAGKVIITGSEGAADAITLDANDDAASGVDIDVGATNGMAVDGGLTDFGTGTYEHASTAGDVGINGDLEVETTAYVNALDVDGGDITLQNDETISNEADGVITVTVPSDGYFYLAAGNLAVGDRDSASVAMDGADAYIEGTLEVDGAVDIVSTLNVTGAVDLDSTLDVDAAATVNSLDVDGGDITMQNDETLSNEADGTITATVDSAGFFYVSTGNFSVGDYSAASVALNGVDAYVEGSFEVDGAVDINSTLVVTGAVDFDSTLNVAAATTLAADVSNIIAPSVIISEVLYTSVDGGTGTLATVGDGEIWVILNCYANVTADWDVTAGDDAHFEVGDTGDDDGILDLDDAELQAADTDVANGPAGWQGYGADTIGDYMAAGAGYIIAPSGSPDTIDIAWGATGDDLEAGALTLYLVYIRIQ